MKQATAPHVGLSTQARARSAKRGSRVTSSQSSPCAGANTRSSYVTYIEVPASRRRPRRPKSGLFGYPHNVVEPEDDFDDAHDEGRDDDWGTPPLPPDDRLWRHPSELGAHTLPISAEALSARRSWMATTPTRAGAWSAGIVGALLATGV